MVLDFSRYMRIMKVRGETMQRLGFIHDMLDVKVLILCVTSRSNYPMTMQEIYEVCY